MHIPLLYFLLKSRFIRNVLTTDVIQKSSSQTDRAVIFIDLCGRAVLRISVTIA